MALALQQNAENYSEIPLLALRYSTRSRLSYMLNGTKIIPSPSNLPRDWRGIAHVAGVCSPHVNCQDPTAFVLSLWEKENPSINKLIEALKGIDRWDVIDDTETLIENDVKEYQKAIRSRNILTIKKEECEKSVLTVDDVNCIESCGKPQYYDAFLLYDDSDSEFALTILSKLENEYSLKLCVKDRDLIVGLPFEHEAIMQLIRDRCRRLIVVVSPTFLESPANKFFLTFAQALGIEQQQRKIIPCIYKKFILPLQLHYYFVLDFTRSSSLWNFWDRLSQSIAVPRQAAILPSQSTASIEVSSRVEIKEVESLTTKNWECTKAPAAIPLAPPASAESIAAASNQEGVRPPAINSNISSVSSLSCKTLLTSSTGESLSGQSESEPILKDSRSNSTVSLLSRVFVSPRISKPKTWFKKKKKVAVVS